MCVLYVMTLIGLCDVPCMMKIILFTYFWVNVPHAHLWGEIEGGSLIR